MADALGWLGENWMLIVGTAGTVCMGASLAVKAIAPHTKTDLDDKAANWLTKAYTWLNRIALNPPVQK